MTRSIVPANRVLRALVALLFVFSLLIVPSGSSPVASADPLSSRISAAKARQADVQQALARQQQLLSQLQSDSLVAHTALDSTSQGLAGINADQAAIRKQIATATEALAHQQRWHDALAQQLTQLDYKLGLLESEISQGSDELEARRRLLGQRLAEAYRSQNTSLLEQVFTSASFTDVLTQASAYLAYGDQDAQLARDISDDQASLDSLRSLTASTRYRTDQLRRDAQAAAIDLAAQQVRLREAKVQSAKLERKVSAIQAQQLSAAHTIAANTHATQVLVAQRAKAKQQLDAKIAGLVQEAERQAAAREAARKKRDSGGGGGGGGGGGLPQGNGPLEWPTSGLVTQEYGCTGFPLEPPRGSCAHFHSGIDIANSAGTPIRAAADGVVAFVGWNPYDGYSPAFIIVIGHSGGLETYYAHLQPRYVVRSGQFVKQGQLIGYMGDTGNSTGPHLHWEVRVHGHDTDPRPYI